MAATSSVHHEASVQFIGGTATLLLPILFFMGATVYLFIGAGLFGGR